MIGLPFRRDCAAHRSALVEFAARRADGPDVRRALDHVDRCPACEEELAATTLVLHALRRLHEETRRVEPAPDGWSRLRTRLATTRRQPSRLLSGLPGIVVAAGLCAALVGPAAVSGGRPDGVYNEAPRGAPAPYLTFEQSRERARLAGLLPEPQLEPPYLGIRTAPPPIAADLPWWSDRQRLRAQAYVEPEPAAVAAATGNDAASSRAGRR